MFHPVRFVSLVLLAVALALPARAAPVLDFGVGAFMFVDAGNSHWFTNAGGAGLTTTGLITQGVSDTHLGGAQIASTSAYASLGSLGGAVLASTSGAFVRAQGSNDLSWYTDFLVTGVPGTKVAYNFAADLDALVAPVGERAGGVVRATTFVAGSALADWVLSRSSFDGPGLIDEFVMATYEFDVGTVVRLASRLGLSAAAEIEGSAQTDALHTSTFYVDVLTPGGGYVTGGGVVFPNLPRSVVPAPAPILLLALALAALALARLRRAGGVLAACLADTRRAVALTLRSVPCPTSGSSADAAPRATLATLLLAGFAAAHGAPVVVVDNLDQPIRNPAHVQNDFWSAQSFVTAAGPSLWLDRVTLRLGVLLGSPDIVAELRADSAGAPGALLTTFSLPPLSDGPTENEVMLPQDDLALDGATAYWLIMGVRGAGGLDWSYAAGNAASGGGAFAEYAYSLTQGASWIGFGLEDPYMARVELVDRLAVPAPSMPWLLIAVAAACLAARPPVRPHRHRRQRDDID